MVGGAFLFGKKIAKNKTRHRKDDIDATDAEIARERLGQVGGGSLSKERALGTFQRTQKSASFQKYTQKTAKIREARALASQNIDADVNKASDSVPYTKKIYGLMGTYKEILKDIVGQFKTSFSRKGVLNSEQIMNRFSGEIDELGRKTAKTLMIYKGLNEVLQKDPVEFYNMLTQTGIDANADVARRRLFFQSQGLSKLNKDPQFRAEKVAESRLSLPDARQQYIDAITSDVLKLAGINDNVDDFIGNLNQGVIESIFGDAGTPKQPFIAPSEQLLQYEPSEQFVNQQVEEQPYEEVEQQQQPNQEMIETEQQQIQEENVVDTVSFIQRHLPSVAAEHLESEQQQQIIPQQQEEVKASGFPPAGPSTMAGIVGGFKVKLKSSIRPVALPQMITSVIDAAPSDVSTTQIVGLSGLFNKDSSALQTINSFNQKIFLQVNEDVGNVIQQAYEQDAERGDKVMSVGAGELVIGKGMGGLEKNKAYIPEIAMGAGVQVKYGAKGVNTRVNLVRNNYAELINSSYTLPRDDRNLPRAIPRINQIDEKTSQVMDRLAQALSSQEFKLKANMGVEKEIFPLFSGESLLYAKQIPIVDQMLTKYEGDGGVGDDMETDKIDKKDMRNIAIKGDFAVMSMTKTPGYSNLVKMLDDKEFIAKWNSSNPEDMQYNPTYDPAKYSNYDIDQYVKLRKKLEGQSLMDMDVNMDAADAENPATVAFRKSIQRINLSNNAHLSNPQYNSSKQFLSGIQDLWLNGYFDLQNNIMKSQKYETVLADLVDRGRYNLILSPSATGMNPIRALTTASNKRSIATTMRTVVDLLGGSDGGNSQVFFQAANLKKEKLDEIEDSFVEALGEDSEIARKFNEVGLNTGKQIKRGQLRFDYPIDFKSMKKTLNFFRAPTVNQGLANAGIKMFRDVYTDEETGEGEEFSLDKAWSNTYGPINTLIQAAVQSGPLFDVGYDDVPFDQKIFFGDAVAFSVALRRRGFLGEFGEETRNVLISVPHRLILQEKLKEVAYRMYEMDPNDPPQLTSREIQAGARAMAARTFLDTVMPYNKKVKDRNHHTKALAYAFMASEYDVDKAGSRLPAEEAEQFQKRISMLRDGNLIAQQGGIAFLQSYALQLKEALVQDLVSMPVNDKLFTTMLTPIKEKVLQVNRYAFSPVIADVFGHPDLITALERFQLEMTSLDIDKAGENPKSISYADTPQFLEPSRPKQYILKSSADGEETVTRAVFSAAKFIGNVVKQHAQDSQFVQTFIKEEPFGAFTQKAEAAKARLVQKQNTQKKIDRLEEQIQTIRENPTQRTFKNKINGLVRKKEALEDSYEMKRDSEKLVEKQKRYLEMAEIAKIAKQEEVADQKMEETKDVVRKISKTFMVTQALKRQNVENELKSTPGFQAFVNMDSHTREEILSKNPQWFDDIPRDIIKGRLQQLIGEEHSYCSICNKEGNPHINKPLEFYMCCGYGVHESCVQSAGMALSENIMGNQYTCTICAFTPTGIVKNREKSIFAIRQGMKEPYDAEKEATVWGSRVAEAARDSQNFAMYDLRIYEKSYDVMRNDLQMQPHEYQGDDKKSFPVPIVRHIRRQEKTLGTTDVSRFAMVDPRFQDNLSNSIQTIIPRDRAYNNLIELASLQNQVSKGSLVSDVSPQSLQSDVMQTFLSGFVNSCRDERQNFRYFFDNYYRDAVQFILDSKLFNRARSYFLYNDFDPQTGTFSDGVHISDLPRSGKKLVEMFYGQLYNRKPYQKYEKDDLPFLSITEREFIEQPNPHIPESVRDAQPDFTHANEMLAQAEQAFASAQPVGPAMLPQDRSSLEDDFVNMDSAFQPNQQEEERKSVDAMEDIGEDPVIVEEINTASGAMAYADRVKQYGLELMGESTQNIVYLSTMRPDNPDKFEDPNTRIINELEVDMRRNENDLHNADLLADKTKDELIARIIDLKDQYDYANMRAESAQDNANSEGGVFQSEIERLREQIAELQEQIKKINKVKEQIQEELEDKNRDYRTLDEETEKLRKSEKKLKTEKTQLEEDLETYKSYQKKFEKLQKDVKDGSAEGMEKLLEKMKKEMKATMKIDVRKEVKEELKDEIRDAENTRDRITAETKLKKDEYAKTLKDIEKAKKETEKTADELANERVAKIKKSWEDKTIAEAKEAFAKEKANQISMFNIEKEKFLRQKKEFEEEKAKGKKDGSDTFKTNYAVQLAAFKNLQAEHTANVRILEEKMKKADENISYKDKYEALKFDNTLVQQKNQQLQQEKETMASNYQLKKSNLDMQLETSQADINRREQKVKVEIFDVISDTMRKLGAQQAELYKFEDFEKKDLVRVHATITQEGLMKIGALVDTVGIRLQNYKDQLATFEANYNNNFMDEYNRVRELVGVPRIVVNNESFASYILKTDHDIIRKDFNKFTEKEDELERNVAEGQRVKIQAVKLIQQHAILSNENELVLQQINADYADLRTRFPQDFDGIPEQIQNVDMAGWQMLKGRLNVRTQNIDNENKLKQAQAAELKNLSSKVMRMKDDEISFRSSTVDFLMEFQKAEKFYDPNFQDIVNYQMKYQPSLLQMDTQTLAGYISRAEQRIDDLSRSYTNLSQVQTQLNRTTQVLSQSLDQTKRGHQRLIDAQTSINMQLQKFVRNISQENNQGIPFDIYSIPTNINFNQNYQSTEQAFQQMNNLEMELGQMERRQDLYLEKVLELKKFHEDKLVPMKDVILRIADIKRTFGQYDQTIEDLLLSADIRGIAVPNFEATMNVVNNAEASANLSTIDKITMASQQYKTAVQQLHLHVKNYRGETDSTLQNVQFNVNMVSTEIQNIISGTQSLQKMKQKLGNMLMQVQDKEQYNAMRLERNMVDLQTLIETDALDMPAELELLQGVNSQIVLNTAQAVRETEATRNQIVDINQNMADGEQKQKALAHEIAKLDLIQRQNETSRATTTLMRQARRRLAGEEMTNEERDEIDQMIAAKGFMPPGKIAAIANDFRLHLNDYRHRYPTEIYEELKSLNDNTRKFTTSMGEAAGQLRAVRHAPLRVMRDRLLEYINEVVQNRYYNSIYAFAAAESRSNRELEAMDEIYGPRHSKSLGAEYEAAIKNALTADQTAPKINEIARVLLKVQGTLSEVLDFRSPQQAKLQQQLEDSNSSISGLIKKAENGLQAVFANNQMPKQLIGMGVHHQSIAGLMDSFAELESKITSFHHKQFKDSMQSQILELTENIANGITQRLFSDDNVFNRVALANIERNQQLKQFQQELANTFIRSVDFSRGNFDNYLPTAATEFVEAFTRSGIIPANSINISRQDAAEFIKTMHRNFKLETIEALGRIVGSNISPLLEQLNSRGLEGLLLGDKKMMLDGGLIDTNKISSDLNKRRMVENNIRFSKELRDSKNQILKEMNEMRSRSMRNNNNPIPPAHAMQAGALSAVDSQPRLTGRGLIGVNRDIKSYKPESLREQLHAMMPQVSIKREVNETREEHVPLIRQKLQQIQVDNDRLMNDVQNFKMNFDQQKMNEIRLELANHFIPITNLYFSADVLGAIDDDGAPKSGVGALTFALGLKKNSTEVISEFLAVYKNMAEGGEIINEHHLNRIASFERVIDQSNDLIFGFLNQMRLRGGEMNLGRQVDPEDAIELVKKTLGVNPGETTSLWMTEMAQQYIDYTREPNQMLGDTEVISKTYFQYFMSYIANMNGMRLEDNTVLIDQALQELAQKESDFADMRKRNHASEQWEERIKGHVMSTLDKIGIKEFMDKDQEAKKLLEEASRNTFPRIYHNNGQGANVGGVFRGPEGQARQAPGVYGGYNPEGAYRPMMAYPGSQAVRPVDPNQQAQGGGGRSEGAGKRISDKVFGAAGKLGSIDRNDINLLKKLRYDPQTKELYLEGVNGERRALTDAEKSKVIRLIIKITILIYTMAYKDVTEDEKKEIQRKLEREQRVKKDPGKLIEGVNRVAEKIQIDSQGDVVMK